MEIISRLAGFGGHTFLDPVLHYIISRIIAMNGHAEKLVLIEQLSHHYHFVEPMLALGGVSALCKLITDCTTSSCVPSNNTVHMRSALGLLHRLGTTEILVKHGVMEQMIQPLMRTFVKNPTRIKHEELVGLVLEEVLHFVPHLGVLPGTAVEDMKSFFSLVLVDGTVFSRIMALKVVATIIQLNGDMVALCSEIGRIIGIHGSTGNWLVLSEENMVTIILR